MAKWFIILQLCFLACLNQAFAGSSCVCLFKGQTFQIGDTACIMGSKRQCGMRLNNTSWIEIQGSCDQDKLSTVIPPESRKLIAFELARYSKGICEFTKTHGATANLGAVEIAP